VSNGKNIVREIAHATGGTIHEMDSLPDGSGFATVSYPLRHDHWLYADNGYEPPPMPMRMGKDDPRRCHYEQMIKRAAQYAVRAATMKGKEMDFDPDALVQNMVVGMLGYHTPDGLSGLDAWANPSPVPEVYGTPKTDPNTGWR